MSRPIITIDGPAGVGKTTIAGLVAERLGLPYLDSGAMFRFLALTLGENAPNLSDAEISSICGTLNFELKGEGRNTLITCNGKPLPPQIRNENTGLLASKLATRGVVRELLRHSQQSLGKSHALVAEGRDMGTVVFPDARFKFFLEASPQVRALRRFRQLEQKGEKVDLAELEKSIAQRDVQDRQRSLAPLVPAADALIIDTSTLSPEQLLSSILAHIHANGGEIFSPKNKALL